MRSNWVLSKPQCPHGCWLQKPFSLRSPKDCGGGEVGARPGSWVRHFGNTGSVPSQVCQWVFLRFLPVGESVKQEPQPADNVGWTRRSAVQPQPTANAARRGDAARWTAGACAGPGGWPGGAARLPGGLAFALPHCRQAGIHDLRRRTFAEPVPGAGK